MKKKEKSEIKDNKTFKFIIEFIFALALLVGGIISLKPLLNNIHYGLDLQGGFEVLYEVSPLEEDSELTQDMLYSTYKSILKRIDILGVSEPVISIEGDNRIRVKLAGVTNAEEARKTISSTATLSFRDNSDNLLLTSDVLGGEAKVGSDEYKRPAISLRIKDTDAFYEATKKVKNMTNNVMVIWLDFEEGKDSYKKEANLCGTTNSHCLSAARVDKAFASDVIIQGNFTKEEASQLVELINSGALPTRLNELSSRTVEADFGANSLNKTLIAGVIGISIVILIMILVYRFSGFIASIGLVLYTCLSFFLFYLIDGVLTLPGIAAMLLGIGMAVDANVIVFERIKEHLLIGASLDKVYEIGNKTSLTSIIDANITTVIAAIIMFILGESSVKGFATMLIINIIVTIFTMVILTRLLLKLFVKTKLFNNHEGLFIGVNKKKIKKQKELDIPFKKVDIVKHRLKFVIMSVILLFGGSIYYFVSGANYGIDFTGGTSITLSETSKVSVIKEYLTEKEYNVTKTSVNKDEATLYLQDCLDKDDIIELTSEINDNYEVDTDIYVVSSVVKKELVKNAVKSLIIASIGIIIYIAIRFRFNYAISGIIALIHDILFTYLFFTVFKIEIDSIFIASILTIIGYSINDTIVTFDVIRDNYKNMYKNNINDLNKLDELVNISIRRTLFRNIMTSITTMIPVVILLFFGSREIVNFNIALLVGFTSGAYSSIFISNMLWLGLEKKRISKPVKNNKDDDDEVEEIRISGINC